MPPYRYQDYINPYVGRIADSLGSSNDAKARGIANAGQATARGQELSGLAWSRGIQDASQSVANAIADAPRRRLTEQTTEANAIHLRAAKRQERGEQAVSSMMQGAPSPTGANGPAPESYLDANGLFDVQKMTHALASGGYGDIAPSLLQGAERINASIAQHKDYEQKAAAAHAVLIGDTAWGALQLAKTGTPMDQALQFAALPGLATKRFTMDEFQQVSQRILSLPPAQQEAALNALVDQASKLAPKSEKKPGEGDVDRYGRVTVPIPAIPKTTTINGQLVNDATGAPIGKPIPPQPPAVNPETERHNKELERHNAELERISRLTAGRTEAASAETARHNRAMEENARNRVTARPVLSGDANRIADIDTGLSQLSTLTGVQTGVGSSIGASLPDWMTQWTGLGADSKSQQAMIEKVKQIIGKGLEGGVLRKEDEIKYARILPKLGDAPEVAADKIRELGNTLRDKREKTLEALSDANYDVSKFKARTPQAAPVKTAPIKVGGFTVEIVP